MIKDRIKELRRDKSSELIAHPKNWRIHPEKQSSLLKGTLQEIGYADALLAREGEDGKLHLIDGHLRAETTPEQEVPVLVLDLSEKEADKLLAVFDPIGAMAETDKDLLSSLVSELETEEESLRLYFDDVLRPTKGIDESSNPPREVPIPDLFQVVIECEDEDSQRELFEEMTARGLKCRLLNL